MIRPPRQPSARRPTAAALALGCGAIVAAACAGVQSGAMSDGSGGGHGGAGGSGGPRGIGGARGLGGRDASAGDARAERCDDAGDCKCMNIASLGKVAHYGGNSDSTDAFQAYLNAKSNARMTLLPNRTPITPELLSGFDVVILQALEDSEYIGFWTYSQDEIDALAAWVKAGNGLIVLSGYGGNADEVDPDNQLLAFAGITYGKADTFASCPDNFCYCTDSSVPFSGWQPASFIAANMVAPSGGTGAVGVFHGRPITCTDGPDGAGACEIVAADPSDRRRRQDGRPGTGLRLDRRVGHVHQPVGRHEHARSRLQRPHRRRDLRCAAVLVQRHPLGPAHRQLLQHLRSDRHPLRR
jgi:hypothetical protein